MFSSFGIFLTILGIATAKTFHVPDNVNFITRFYHNRSEPAFYNQTLKTMCYNTETYKGHPKCCYTLLDGINVFNTTGTNTTFGSIFGEVNGSLVSYDCKMSNFSSITPEEILSWVGIISIILLVGIVLTCMLRCCSNCCKRDSYNRIN